MLLHPCRVVDTPLFDIFEEFKQTQRTFVLTVSPILDVFVGCLGWNDYWYTGPDYCTTYNHSEN